MCRSDPRTSSSTSEETDEEEQILGSDEDEQEDPKDYCKGTSVHLCFGTWSNKVIWVNLYC